jgi:hypothetical protein
VIRSGFLGRLTEGLFFGALPLLAAWVVARNSPSHRWILVLAVLVALALFVGMLTHTAAVVSDAEVKVRRTTIRRSDVGRVTAPGQAPSLVFRDADDRILRVVNLTETHVATMRTALREHGWPEVEPD